MRHTGVRPARAASTPRNASQESIRNSFGGGPLPPQRLRSARAPPSTPASVSRRPVRTIRPGGLAFWRCAALDGTWPAARDAAIQARRRRARDRQASHAARDHHDRRRPHGGARPHHREPRLPEPLGGDPRSGARRHPRGGREPRRRARLRRRAGLRLRSRRPAACRAG